jgi:timeless
MEASSRNGRDTLANGVMSAAPTAQKVTPPRTTNPASGRSSYTNPSLTVDKSIVNELLLVCGVIGSTVDPKTQEMIPVEDCINWLQDLQRALRRDEDAFRPISLLLGQWKIVEQKLLPLVLSCRYNTPLILTIVKILVILTKPISDNAKNAAGMIIDTRRGKTEQG